MDLKIFRQIVDCTKPGITSCEDDLHKLYDYVGLDSDGHSFARHYVSDALYRKINNSFTSGHAAVFQTCKSLITDLIRENVLDGVELEPYFKILNRIQDAVRTNRDIWETGEGDWSQAIQNAVDHIQFHDWSSSTEPYARDLNVAKAAKFLRNMGFTIRFEPGRLTLEEAGEIALVATIEELIASMGGINVARRIFSEISKSFDKNQQRYHVVRQVSLTNHSPPQLPWGYLIQLSAKHARGSKPYKNTEAQWLKLCNLLTAYAAVLDVQHYIPSYFSFSSMDARNLVPYFQEIAVYDLLFRLPQMRLTDVVKIARGIFSWLDLNKPTNDGWSINQVLEIIDYLLNTSRHIRGPIFIREADIRRACPAIPHQIVTKILDHVLSHSSAGVNRDFSQPIKNVAHDFFLRPLLKSSGRQFILLDGSVCAPACIEALLTALRSEVCELDKNVGIATEEFIKAELLSRNVQVCHGDYDSGGKHGECDLVINSSDAVIFLEIKKKPLTRKARSGSDVHLLLDLAGSFLEAQAQAGWHEVHLRRDGHLNLTSSDNITRIDLDDRKVERIAISLLDFGSFQDRVLLHQFLEGTMGMKFTPVNDSHTKKFNDINNTLREICDQVAALNPGKTEVDHPFFHCWFLSIPQILILLDNVTDNASFKKELWNCRHVATGSSDFYFDLMQMQQLKQVAKSENN